MAKHFDSLIELVRSASKAKVKYPSIPQMPDFAANLENIINDAGLFELLFSPHLLAGDKNNEEYIRYLHDYFNESEKSGSFFLTPFPVTAIEYQKAVYILKPIQGNEYILISCSCGDDESIEKVQKDSGLPQSGQRPVLAMIGKVRIQRPVEPGSAQMMLDVKILASLMSFGQTVQVIDPAVVDGNDRKSEMAMVESAMEFMQGILYIMDPENFILRKESNQARKQQEKKQTKNRQNMLKKTVLRPHYICLSEKDVSEFLSNTANEPRPAHPVRGHWRHLMSEKFRNKKGQTIFIRQYFTGQGMIQSAGGWTYRVMVKPVFGKVVAYDEGNA